VLGCLSAYGLLASLVLAAGVGIAILVRGARLFSPGPLTAEASGTASLQGYDSHAEIQECTLCHRPWGRPEPARCLSCHISVGDEIGAQNGLHGWLDDALTCVDCHPDHQGREADIAHARLDLFPHEQVGYVLGEHTRRADGEPFTCADCHDTEDTVTPVACRSCHEAMNASFADQHTGPYGANCLSCHDGRPLAEDFGHWDVLPLDGAHAQAGCSACHGDASIGERDRRCVDCHEEPEIHGRQFGAECGACHTAQGWQPARLRYHAFPLDHGQVESGSCSTCHPAGYATYTCYSCHTHEPVETQVLHEENGIADLEACARCHPAGGTD
jgi:hypothetical protein